MGILRSFRFYAFFLVLGLFPAVTGNTYLVTFKEQYYRLFHAHHNSDPDTIMENIYWLERALEAPFCNPLYALALIENEVEWEKYRYLFMMHLNIKMAEQHLFLASKYNKRNAYFYNAPFRDENLASLEIAESCFLTAIYYWEEALVWAERANDRRFRWINLRRVQYWEDSLFRIGNGTLNYGRTINRELASLQSVREQFMAMDENTY